MEKDEEPDEAIKKLNEIEMGERKIAVDVARPREERPKFDNRRGSSRENDQGPSGHYSILNLGLGLQTGCGN